jgi:hypothetical protein
MTRLLFFIAFLAFTAFVGILAYEVPSPDLIAVILFTLALVVWDFVSSLRGKRD